jgi:hypothetical protein
MLSQCPHMAIGDSARADDADTKLVQAIPLHASDGARIAGQSPKRIEYEGPVVTSACAAGCTVSPASIGSQRP